MSYLDDAYLSGSNYALIKLGTVAGPIAHAQRESANEFDFAQNKSEDLWKEMDEEPAMTGEESGVGMPSAGGINKTSEDKDYTPGLVGGVGGAVLGHSIAKSEKLPKKARLPWAVGSGVLSGTAMQYGVDKGKQSREERLGKLAADDYARSNGNDYGSFDHNAPKPQRDQILSSAMEEAFRANEDYDQSYGMGEPALTQPHGSKHATDNLFKGTGLSKPKRRLLSGSDKYKQSLDQWAQKHALANPLAGGSSPISMGNIGSPMSTGIKPPSIPKVKPPGLNNLSDMHQNSNMLLSSNSIMSGGTRAIGSPLPTGAQAAGGSLA